MMKALRSELLILLVMIAIAPSIVHGAEPRLSVELPREEILEGQPFSVHGIIEWPGDGSAWIVREIDGVSAEGATDVGHAVVAGSEQDEDGLRSWQRHEFSFLPSQVGEVTIGGFAVELVGEEGRLRNLRSRPMVVNVQPVFRGGSYGVFGVVAMLVLVVLFVLRARYRRFQVQDVEAASSPRATWSTVLSELERTVQGHEAKDAKGFYEDAMLCCRSLMEALSGRPVGRSHEEIRAAIHDLPSLPPSVVSGMERFVEEVRLVRFAGLRPTSDERRATLGRLRELAAQVHEVKGIEDHA